MLATLAALAASTLAALAVVVSQSITLVEMPTVACPEDAHFVNGKCVPFDDTVISSISWDVLRLVWTIEDATVER